ncbi:MAG: 50S ribosomal protein L23 [Myxococcota bacterium]
MLNRGHYQVLLKPRITEKASSMSTDEQSTVTFEVPLQASKTEIREAVETVFNVEVEQVRTVIVRGKIKRRGRFIGKRPNFKKAIVKLAPGSEIDFFGTAA